MYFKLFISSLLFLPATAGQVLPCIHHHQGVTFGLQTWKALLLLYLEIYHTWVVPVIPGEPFLASLKFRKFPCGFNLKNVHVTCRSVKDKVKSAVAEHFAIDVSSLHLTHPTFFSRLDSKKAVTAHDEYWHMHVDKETYPEFHYTSLLYLTDHGRDFRGGDFVFVDSNDRMNRSDLHI